MKSRLSIIVPVYNVEKYIPKCLDSLINQTFEDIEIILVNDGSIDNSEKICREYARLDSRIKLFSKSNGGLSDARNYGLSHATAEVVGFVDSDDYVDTDMFGYLLKRKEFDHSDIVVCGIKMVTNDCREYIVRALDSDVVINRYDAMMELLKSKKISNSVCNKIFDKRLFYEIEFPSGKLYEDEYVTYKLFHKANTVSITNKVFYYYRQNPYSITHKPFSEREFDRVYASQIKVKFIKDNYPDLVPYACRYLVYDCVMALSKMSDYKASYNELIRDNIRKYLKYFMSGDYSKGTKIFAFTAAFSPKLSVMMYKMMGYAMLCRLPHEEG